MRKKSEWSGSSVRRASRSPAQKACGHDADPVLKWFWSTPSVRNSRQKILVVQHRPLAQSVEQPVLHLARGGLGVCQTQDVLRLSPVQQQPSPPGRSARGSCPIRHWLPARWTYWAPLPEPGVRVASSRGVIHILRRAGPSCGPIHQTGPVGRSRRHRCPSAPCGATVKPCPGSR